MKPKPYILIVDDEKDIREFLGYSLRREGFEVGLASNGEEGLDALEVRKPDLILLDIMMPGMDGVEMCRVLRSHRNFDDVLVVFLTARDEERTQIKALDIGGDDYIAKPIRLKVLLSRLKALLRRQKQGGESFNSLSANALDDADARLAVADFVIDKEKMLVLRGEEKITLPKKEFELLRLLASKPGKVFTREEIFASVWEADVIVGARTIDVHIRKLRAKLGEGYIKTVKGVGYSLEG